MKILRRCIKCVINFFLYGDAVPKALSNRDIFIVDFPKSGITWLGNILANIELNLAGSSNRVTYFNAQMHLSDVSQMRGASVQRNPERTYLKSHSKYNPHYFQVIYLVRNPVDVMISYYNFMLDHGYKKDFDTFIRTKRYGVRAWKAHVASWNYGRIDAQRIHFVRYEDLKADTSSVVKELMENIGITIGDNEISACIELSSLSQMKKSELLYKKHNPNYTVNFVGANNKKFGIDMVTENTRNWILLEVKDVCKYFYQELYH